MGRAAAQQVTRGRGAGRSCGRAGSHADVRGNGGGGERAVPSPPPPPARLPLTRPQRLQSAGPYIVRAAGGLRAPGAASGAHAGCSRNQSTALPPARRRASRRSPRGPPRPRGPVPYQLGGEPGRPSGSEKSRHWEVLGEGGAGLKGTTTSFHWGSGGTEEVPKLERNGKNVKLLRSFWLAPLFPLILSPTFHLNQEKKSPSCLWFTWQFSPFAECF